VNDLEMVEGALEEFTVKPLATHQLLGHGAEIPRV
jgi:hypothetical protein